MVWGTGGGQERVQIGHKIHIFSVLPLVLSDVVFVILCDIVGCNISIGEIVLCCVVLCCMAETCDWCNADYCTALKAWSLSWFRQAKRPRDAAYTLIFILIEVVL